MLIAPFAPHLAEEFWNLLGNQFSIFTTGVWPEYDEKFLVSSEITLAVQFNGKMRGTLQIAADARQEEVLELIKKGPDPFWLEIDSKALKQRQKFLDKLAIQLQTENPRPLKVPKAKAKDL